MPDLHALATALLIERLAAEDDALRKWVEHYRSDALDALEMLVDEVELKGG